MTTPFRPTYTRRPVPTRTDALPMWLPVEFHAIQRAIAPSTVSTVTANTTLTQSDGVALGDATAGAFTVTVPDAAVALGQVVTVKKIDASGNAVTIASAGGTIDGVTTVALAARWNSRTLVSNGTNWYIIATV
jgi:hypothetical protein